MCDSCAEKGLSAIESYITYLAIENPELIWLLNAYKKFRSQLPPDVIEEIENQFRTIINTSAKAAADQAAVTLFVTYGLILLITIFLFSCILVNNSTLTGVLFFISIVLIVVAILYVLYYNSSTADALAITIQSITNHLKNTIRGAIEAGLCCAAGIDCSSPVSSCSTDAIGGVSGGCNCLNVPIISFTAVPTTGPVPLSVTFNDTSTYPRLSEFFPLLINPPVSWTWNFGDGTTATSPTNTVTHTYNTRGTFHATMSVSLKFFEATYISEPITITVT